MGPDLCATVVANLNQVLGKPPTSELELDRVHCMPGPLALYLAFTGPHHYRSATKCLQGALLHHKRGDLALGLGKRPN